MNSDQEGFEAKLDQLGDLYEEGKDCLALLYSPDPKHARLYEILREMRDIAAVSMKAVHTIDEN